MMSGPKQEMQVVSALAMHGEKTPIADALSAQVNAAFPDHPPDLALLFASAHFEEEVESLGLQLQESVRPRSFIGQTAETVIHNDKEYESQPAIVLWAARLPEVSVVSFHLSQDDLEQLDGSEALSEHLGVPAEVEPYFLLLGDPFTIDILDLLNKLREVWPARPALGGLASAGEHPGENRLIFDGQTLRNGVSGVALWGNIHIEAVVSQGCRPIGRHLVITKAEKNVIYQLGGKPPLALVTELLQQCSPRDLELARTRGLLVGRVINEYQKTFSRGDFLIRNPIGFDSNTGAMAINDLVRTGQTIQFHVRDSATADEDLSSLLEHVPIQPAAGALLFSCNGRGTRLFSDRNHDARTITQRSGNPPLAGCFCAGEIGPVGDRNFLHGHTASIGFFRPAHAD